MPRTCRRPGQWLGALLFTALLAATASASECAGKLGPSAKVPALLDMPDQVFRFVIRGDEAGLKTVLNMASTRSTEPAPAPLASLGSVAVSLAVHDAVDACALAGVEQVWYLNPLLANAYENTLKGLDYLVRTLDPPSVINMSLGPPEGLYPIPGDDDEPMHHATKRAAEKGLLPVIAIGNFNEFGQGVVNPWCRAPWVICVGAASEDGRSLWSKSSTGDPSDRKTWPDAVAHGINVIGAWPTNIQKSEKRRRDDESVAEFMRQIPKDQQHLYTVMSGSSQAAAQVSRSAAQVIYFVQSLAAANAVQAGERLFALEIPKDRFDFLSRRGPRYTGTVVSQSAGTVEVEYRLVEPWKLVKQLLLDTALPMPGYGPHEVGAGFVSPQYVEAQFGRSGRAQKTLVPVKVMN